MTYEHERNPPLGGRGHNAAKESKRAAVRRGENAETAGAMGPQKRRGSAAPGEAESLELARGGQMGRGEPAASVVPGVEASLTADERGSIEVHRGREAQHAARQLGAAAYAHRGSVVLGAPTPPSAVIREELIHAQQQRSEDAPTTRQSGRTTASEPAEREARDHASASDRGMVVSSGLGMESVALHEDESATGERDPYGELNSKLDELKYNEETHAKYAALIETIKQKGAAAGQELLATVDKNDPDRERKIVGGVIDATRLEFEALNNMYHPGCGGASELLRGILVDLGINAQVITEAHESHRYLFLPDSGLGLVHGDDLYNKAIFELEGQELLKTQAEIEKHWEGDAKIRESAANDLVLDLAESNIDPQMVERRDAMASSKLVSGDEAINYFDEKSGQWAQWSVSIGEVLSNAAFPPGYLNYIAGADDQRATVLEPEKVQEVYRSACVDYGYTQAEAWNGTGKTITDRAEAVRRVAVIMGQGLYGEIIDTKVLSEEKYEQMTGELGAETYGDKYSRDYPKTPDDKQYWAKRRKKKNAELKQQGKLSDIATSE